MGGCLHHELAALQAELGKASGAGSKPRSAFVQQEVKGDAADDAVPSLAADLQEQLGELGRELSAYTDGVEEAIAEHPLASVLGAFLFGLALGCMMRRA